MRREHRRESGLQESGVPLKSLLGVNSMYLTVILSRRVRDSEVATCVTSLACAMQNLAQRHVCRTASMKSEVGSRRLFPGEGMSLGRAQESRGSAVTCLIWFLEHQAMYADTRVGAVSIPWKAALCSADCYLHRASGEPLLSFHQATYSVLLGSGRGWFRESDVFDKATPSRLRHVCLYAWPLWHHEPGRLDDRTARGPLIRENSTLFPMATPCRVR
jgi:hypothetical protein